MVPHGGHLPISTEAKWLNETSLRVTPHPLTVGPTSAGHPQVGGVRVPARTRPRAQTRLSPASQGAHPPRQAIARPIVAALPSGPRALHGQEVTFVVRRAAKLLLVVVQVAGFAPPQVQTRWAFNVQVGLVPTYGGLPIDPQAVPHQPLASPVQPMARLETEVPTPAAPDVPPLVAGVVAAGGAVVAAVHTGRRVGHRLEVVLLRTPIRPDVIPVQVAFPLPSAVHVVHRRHDMSRPKRHATTRTRRPVVASQDVAHVVTRQGVGLTRRQPQRASSRNETITAHLLTVEATARHIPSVRAIRLDVALPVRPRRATVRAAARLALRRR